jgi:hypothetical protein
VQQLLCLLETFLVLELVLDCAPPHPPAQRGDRQEQKAATAAGGVHPGAACGLRGLPSCEAVGRLLSVAWGACRGTPARPPPANSRDAPLARSACTHRGSVCACSAGPRLALACARGSRGRPSGCAVLPRGGPVGARCSDVVSRRLQRSSHLARITVTGTVLRLVAQLLHELRAQPSLPTALVALRARAREGTTRKVAKTRAILAAPE